MLTGSAASQGKARSVNSWWLLLPDRKVRRVRNRQVLFQNRLRLVVLLAPFRGCAV